MIKILWDRIIAIPIFNVLKHKVIFIQPRIYIWNYFNFKYERYVIKIKISKKDLVEFLTSITLNKKIFNLFFFYIFK